MPRALGTLALLSLVLVVPSCGDRPAASAKDQTGPALMALGTGAASPAEKPAGVAPARNASEPPGLPGRATDSLVASMIIRTGQAEVRVDSLEPAIRLVEDLARRVGGFIANSSIQSGEGQRRQAMLQIRVPAARWDQAVSGLRTIGTLVSSTTEAQDVGEEYVDVTARMSNSRRLEERLIALLANRTGKLDDVLTVERELARVREEIERFEGRLRYLRSSAAVSTLAITLTEPGPVLGEPGSHPLQDAVKQAWRNFVAFIAALIQSLGVLIPVVVIFGSVWLGWKRWGAKPRMASE